MDLRTEIENIVHEILMEGVTKEEAVKELLNLHSVSGFSSEKIKQAYEDGQWDSEEGKGDKFNINNYS